MVEGQGVQVVHAGGIGHELGKGAGLGQLFVHAVDVAQDRLGVDDVFAVHGELDAQHPVSRRMLRPQIEDEGLVRPQVNGNVHGW